MSKSKSSARIYNDAVVISTPIVGGEDHGTMEENVFHNLESVTIAVPFANSRIELISIEVAMDIIRTFTTKALLESVIEHGDEKALFLCKVLGIPVMGADYPVDSEEDDLDAELKAAFAALELDDNDTCH